MIYLHKHTKLGYMSPLEPDCRGYKAEDQENALELAVHAPRTNSQRILEDLRDSTIKAGNTVTHPTGVTIYNHPDHPEYTDALYRLITEFADVFQNTGFAIVPEDEQPIFHLTPGWEKEIPKKCRVYPLNAEDQQVVKNTMSELEKTNRVSRTRQPVPFSFPVFVIWRSVSDPATGVKRKGRMVVDVRPFNKINLPDSYPMKSQDDMLQKISGMTFITMLDAIAFYYQWLTHPSTRSAMTVTTAHGQYTFNCLVMGYKNSNAYVQRQMDIILEPIPAADCYCDDICVASPEFQAHYQDLRQLLTLLRLRNISIGPSKSFVGFPNAVVLGRLVDSFGLSTTKQRLEAIAKLAFPTSLKDLETFLGMAGYLRNNIPRYAQLVEPLERRKTNMLRANPRRHAHKAKDTKDTKPTKQTKSGRKKWAANIPIDTPTEAERVAFEALRESLTRYTTLHFFSTQRPLCIDFDVSRRGIGVSVYHIAENSLPKISSPEGKLVTFPPSTAIQPIAFLSRTLANAEKNYWPTEMEVLGFVWALRKTQHWINVACSTYIFTDHRSIIGLTNHKDIVNSTALSNQNLRLVRAMEYISRFTFTVLHKPGKLHIIPDALSRLPTVTESPEPHPDLEFLPDDAEEQWAFPADVLPALRLATTFGLKGDQPSKGIALIQMSPEFKAQLRQGYKEDPKWVNTLKLVTQNMNLDAANQANLPFQLRDGLLWKIGETADRLCIPRNCAREIFELLHGDNHVGDSRFQAMASQFVINRKELKKYLRTCPECAMFRNRNHKPYGSLQPILSPPCPFHTITIDIALALPMSHQQHNAFMVAVCKLSKAPQIIPGRHDWTAFQWADKLLDRLLLATWGIPKVMLSDRDPKFLADLWKHIWTRLGTRLLYATAYHPATDGQSERFILTIKSTLRYYFHALEDPADWENAVPRLQFELHNVTSATTGQTPAEVILGFTPNFILEHVGAPNTIPDPLRLKSRIEVSDAIALSSMTAKMYYDQRHQPMFFKPGDKVLLRLHKGYNIPKAASLGRKLGQQYAGPFEVLDRIGRSAYKLKFPNHFKIHDVISVDHLEPAPPMDYFGRQLPYPGDVHLEIHNKRIIDEDHDKRKYLLEYVGLGPEYHKWVTFQELGDEAAELIVDYRRRRPATKV
ncbi:hypothetical protein SAMD00023353_2201730 [Rosellinia necatrix]|uniref:Integrase catalytic domain-containing protein n=1 Tax=Rosellinia necatrix TaxID=77044 RepID=A0A1S8A860_ROSNE|nr:hypothetical protein SAMD00023353_2201730 [Rosellinia necatrix]